MKQIRRLRFWAWGAAAVLLLCLLCLLFLKNSALTGEEVVMPMHEAVQETDPSALAVRQEDFKAARMPLRRESTLCQGDLVFAVLLQNGISRSQARSVLDAARDVFDLSRALPGHKLALVFSPESRDLALLEYEISDLSLLKVTVAGDSATASRQPVGRELPPVQGRVLKQVYRVAGQGDGIGGILGSCGVSGVQARAVCRAAAGVCGNQALAPGNALSLWVTDGDRPLLAMMACEIDGRSILEVDLRSGACKARKLTRKLGVRYERAEWTISSSLPESAAQAGLPPEVVMGLTDIFAWDINFFTDIREGDSFQVLYERYYAGTSFKGCGRVVAARFLCQGREHMALYYSDGHDVEGYFDEEGRPVRKLFLKAPLNCRSVFMSFSPGRMHPVLHGRGPCLRADYAAPSGTPVVALGPGRVIYKGSSKGLGRSIQIRHPSGYVTCYGHLSGYPRGVSPGEDVDQGEVIGYVGMTGNATAPHLDFRIRLNGRFVDPLILEAEGWPGLKGSALAQFQAFKARRLAMLDDLSLNYTIKLSTTN
jgi:murein DD-endopeptidase MepM/ murein hydrolase activator NlpD